MKMQMERKEEWQGRRYLYPFYPLSLHHHPADEAALPLISFPVQSTNLSNQHLPARMPTSTICKPYGRAPHPVSVSEAETRTTASHAPTFQQYHRNLQINRENTKDKAIHTCCLIQTHMLLDVLNVKAMPKASHAASSPKMAHLTWRQARYHPNIANNPHGDILNPNQTLYSRPSIFLDQASSFPNPSMVLSPDTYLVFPHKSFSPPQHQGCLTNATAHQPTRP